MKKNARIEQSTRKHKGEIDLKRVLCFLGTVGLTVIMLDSILISAMTSMRFTTYDKQIFLDILGSKNGSDYRYEMTYKKEDSEEEYNELLFLAVNVGHVEYEEPVVSAAGTTSSITTTSSKTGGTEENANPLSADLTNEDLQGDLYEQIEQARSFNYILTNKGIEGVEYALGETIRTTTDILETGLNEDIGYIFNITGYSCLDKRQKKEIIQNFTDDVIDSNMSEMGKQTLYNYLSQYDDAILNNNIIDLITEATTPNTTSFIAEIMGSKAMMVFRIILGILCFFVLLSLGITTALDIAWLTIPLFHEFIDTVCKDEGKPKFITTRAWNCYNEYLKTNSGNLLFNYTTKTVGVYILIIGSISYLLMGGLGSLVASISGLF